MVVQATARDFDMIAAWSVDRLGRSLQDLIGFMNELRALGVDLYLHQQALDTSTPSGRAMFQMLGVFAEFERCYGDDPDGKATVSMRAPYTAQGG